MRKRERNHKSRSNLKERERKREREREREEIPVMRRRHGEDDRPAGSGGVASSLGNNIKEKRKGRRETNQNCLKKKKTV